MESGMKPPCKQQTSLPPGPLVPSHLSIDISKSADASIRTSAGFRGPRLREWLTAFIIPFNVLHASRQQTFSEVRCEYFCFSRVFSFLLERKPLHVLAQIKMIKRQRWVYFYNNSGQRRRGRETLKGADVCTSLAPFQAVGETLSMRPLPARRHKTGRIMPVACLLTTVGGATDLGDISQRL